MRLAKGIIAIGVSLGFVLSSGTAGAAAVKQQAVQAAYEKNELIVQWKTYMSPMQRASLLRGFRLEEKDYIIKGNYSVIKWQGSESISALSAKLLRHSSVAGVEPNYKLRQSSVPSDPYFGRQWYMNKINTTKAWDITKGSGNVTVAVIDGAVQVNHPDMTGKSIKMYDAASETAQLPAADDHGTHVAGIIGAAWNGRGIAGVASGVRIMPINVFYEDGYTSTAEVSRAILYAVDNGADVINMSLGGYENSSILNTAVQYASSKGVVVVASAGNEATSYPMYPAALGNVISVSAVDAADRRSSFSNYGSTIDFAAPGENMYSTLAGSTYGSMSGTSMAAPVVSGTAALILSKNPFLTPSQVYSLLKKSAVDLGAKGRDSYYGEGRIDAYQAVYGTPGPLSRFAVSAKTLVTDGTSAAHILFSTYGSMNVTVFVTDSSGKTVRTLLNKRAGTENISVSWKGNLTDGSYVKPGQYRVNVKLTDGKNTVQQSASLTITAPSPAVKLSSSKLVLKKTSFSISYQQYSTMTATILVKDQWGKTVRTLAVRKGGTGRASLAWSGIVTGSTYVKPGTYRISVKLTDGKRSFVQELPMQATAN